MGGIIAKSDLYQAILKPYDCNPPARLTSSTNFQVLNSLKG